MKQFFADIWEFWQETWRTDKTLFWLEAFGAILGLWAATYLGWYATDPNMWIVLTPWGISAILMTIAAYKRRSAWLMLVMFCYAINNFVGITKLIIG